MRAELRDLLRPRLERLTRRVAAGDPAQSRVPLRDGCAVLGRQPSASGYQPPERAVEVRAPRRGPALDDDEPVRREDERRDLRAQLLGRAQRRPVQPRALALAPAASPRARSPPRRGRREAPRGLPPRRSGSAARRSACAARSPACRRAATRAGSSCRPRSAPPRARAPARGRGRASRTSGSSGARPSRRSAAPATPPSGSA